ncbi:MAG TPA: acyl-CoA dehydrogenase family protein [Acidimicrobiia bacterium]|nr:acyl-CoA dehydrogenase family protein [Acidimicrobiia bacterium]
MPVPEEATLAVNRGAVEHQAVDVLDTARRLADDVLFPAAAQTDAADAVPRKHLDLFAEAGLYGLAGPVEHGGLGATPEVLRGVVEVLAGGCLATTFIWAQHGGLVKLLQRSDPSPWRDGWLRRLCSGEARGGLALGGLLPGEVRLRAEPDGDGWVVDGTSPWVSGWGLVDVVLVAARGPDDTVVWLMVDAVEGDGLAVHRQRLGAVDASVTVTAEFTGHPVPGDRLIRVEAFSADHYNMPEVLRQNGYLALGVTGRCCRVLGPTPFDAELAACRDHLGRAGPVDIAPARAAASHLALRAASALVVATGSRAAVRHDPAERLAREAMFLLVFGSRPAIKAALLDRFGIAGEG